MNTSLLQDITCVHFDGLDLTGLATSQHLVLTELALSYLESTLKDSDITNTSMASKQAEIITIDDETSTDTVDHWIKCGRVLLKKKDRQQIVSGKELSDVHVNAFHSIAREQFKEVGSLYNTLVLHKMTLPQEGHMQSLQILHMNGRAHWAALEITVIPV